MFAGSSGSVLCKVLVKAYDTARLGKQQQALGIHVNSLKALLAISQTAKHTALEGNIHMCYVSTFKKII